ncbi:hypothetical protein JTB14_016249 [Gonioctena quinquepunctata]|nr:hypothetical protein JTB14_016249 [Gonioctena quinquepunctata]
MDPEDSVIEKKVMPSGMNPKQEVDFAQAFETEKTLLSFFGYYPRKNNILAGSSLRTIFCLGSAILSISFAYMLILTAEYAKLLDDSVLIISVTAFIYKLVHFLSMGKELRLIESFIANMRTSAIPDSISEYVYEDSMKRNRMAVYYRIGILFYMILFVSMPFLQRQRMILPLLIWAPYDQTRTELFFATLAVETLVIAMVAYCNSSMDLIYYVLVDLSCCQMDIVAENLRRIDLRRRVDAVQSELKCHESRNKATPNNCSRKNWFVKTIEIAFSNSNFGQCIASALSISFLIFQLIVVVEFPSVKFFIGIAFTNVIFFQTLAYCWFGQNITIKSAEVGEACYMTNWYEADVRVRKTIYIMMERCKKPLEIKAKLFTFNLSLFVTILRTSYSYMAVMRRLYNE